ncbi:MAG: hypothetical protein HY666_05000 [Chloroflexi bacterium]|nr:hypothetical protein [Chloroflexota bacterium]
MKFRMSHEVLFEIILEASSRKEAERLAAEIPYAQWEEKYVVRDECVAVAESPINPHAE